MIQHKHVVIRAEIKIPPAKHEMEFMREWFEGIINDLHMKILSGPHMAYCDMVGNKGFTGVCIIETSHIAVHVWDEDDPSLIEFDVYTCGAMDVNVVLNHLEVFEPVKIEYMLLDREHTIMILDKGEITNALV